MHVMFAHDFVFAFVYYDEMTLSDPPGGDLVYLEATLSSWTRW